MVSLIGPLRHVLSKYNSLIAKIHEDKDDKKWNTKARVRIGSCMLVF
jgi:hypothetical protein